MSGWKLFQRLYDRLMAPLERRGVRDIRKDLVGKAAGRVLEIGSGTGLNFPYYRDASEVTAIEPDPVMRKQSLARAAAGGAGDGVHSGSNAGIGGTGAGLEGTSRDSGIGTGAVPGDVTFPASCAKVPIRVMAGSAEAMPFPDDAFDTVVCTLVLCSVASPEAVLQELRRVCRPGGAMLFFEHVRLDHPILGKLQDGLTPIWKRMCDGCRLNRDTLRLIRQSGIEVERVEAHYKEIFLVMEGVNRKN